MRETTGVTSDDEIFSGAISGVRVDKEVCHEFGKKCRSG